MKTENSVSHKNSVTIAFRVSREDYNEIKMLADLSGLVKQDYLLNRALNKEITVYPNIRIKKYLEQYLSEILKEIKNIETVDNYSDIFKRLELLLDITERL